MFSTLPLSSGSDIYSLNTEIQKACDKFYMYGAEASYKYDIVYDSAIVEVEIRDREDPCSFVTLDRMGMKFSGNGEFYSSVVEKFLEIIMLIRKAHYELEEYEEILRQSR